MDEMKVMEQDPVQKVNSILIWLAVSLGGMVVTEISKIDGRVWELTKNILDRPRLVRGLYTFFTLKWLSLTVSKAWIKLKLFRVDKTYFTISGTVIFTMQRVTHVITSDVQAAPRKEVDMSLLKAD